MTVDFDSISKAVNNQPKLLNDTDVSNIRKIVDANPSLFEMSWDQPNTKRRDAGVYLKKTIKDGVDILFSLRFHFLGIVSFLPILLFSKLLCIDVSNGSCR